MGRAPLLLLPAAALIAACAQPEVRPSPTGDFQRARQLLAVEAQKGNVPITIVGAPPSLAPDEVAKLAAEGVRGLAVSFTPVEQGTVPGRRLVLVFDPPATATDDELCAAPASSGAPVAPNVGLRALFCEGNLAVADVSGKAAAPSTQSVRRLVWQTTSQLFPDDYPDTYGFDLFGMRVGLGGSFGF